MKKTTGTLVVLATLSLLASTLHATPFTIDDFAQPSVGQSVGVWGAGSASATVTGLVGVVGGARTMQVTALSSRFGLSSWMHANPIGLRVGTLSMDNDTGQNGVGTITWDANGAGLGGVDLTNGGTLPYLYSKILASDLDLGFRCDITETAVAGGSTAFWSTNLYPGFSYVNEPLTNFTNAANVDFTQVDKIVLTLSGPFAQDVVLDLVEVTNTPEPATLPGDADHDGKVSFADYLILEQNFGKSGMNWAHADFNNDGKVTFADYLLLEQNFGQSVPEPPSLSLLALAGLATLRRRK